MMMKCKLFLNVVGALIFFVAEKNAGIIAARNTDRERDVQTSALSTDLKLVSKEELPASRESELNRIWVSQLFDQAEDVFDVHPNVSHECRRSFDLYKLHLRNQTVWAVRILESSDWPTNELLTGNVRRAGDWDGCLRAVGPANIKGKYCLVETQIIISRSRKLVNWNHWPDESSSAWDVLEMYADDPGRLDRRALSWALCIPSLCTASDIKMSLEHTLEPLFQNHSLGVSVDVNPALCTVKYYPHPSVGYYQARAIFGLIILLVIVSSVYDISRNIKGNTVDTESTFWKQIFICFSVKQNISNLTRYSSPTTTNPGIYMIKVIYLCLIITGHRLYSLSLMFPSSPTEEIEMKYASNDVSKIALNVVDVFFMISGFLTFYLGFSSMKKLGSFYFVLSLVFRWLRMMPVFGLMLLFFVFIFPHIGDGPAWNYLVQPEIENCRATWWTILLALSNIVHAEKQCLLVSWYLSVDFQLSILGGILLLIITKHRKIGLWCVLLAFFVSSQIVGIMVYREKYHAILLLWIRTLNIIKKNEEFYKLYISTFSRVGPYLVGFGAAMLAKSLKERKYKFSMKQSAFIVLALLILGRATQYYSFLFYDQSREFNVLEHTIYAVIHRPLFVLPLASIICIYFTSGLGKLNQVFEIKLFIPLGRLIYSAFVVHFMVQLYHVSSARGLMLLPLATNTVLLNTFDIIYSFVIGFFLYLTCEGPICSMTTLLRNYMTRTTEQISDGTKVTTSKNGIQNEAIDERENMPH